MKPTLLEIGPGIQPIRNTKYNITYLDYVDRKVPFDSKFINFNLNNTPLPFKDNSFNVIIAYNILEHLSPIVNGKEAWLERFEEFYRILKPNGIIDIRVPHFTNGFIMEHRIQFSSWNINYIFGEENNWIKDMTKFNFKIIKNEIEIKKMWRLFKGIINYNNTTKEIWEKYFCYIIRSNDLLFRLRAKK